MSTRRLALVTALIITMFASAMLIARTVLSGAP